MESSSEAARMPPGLLSGQVDFASSRRPAGGSVLCLRHATRPRDRRLAAHLQADICVDAPRRRHAEQGRAGLVHARRRGGLLHDRAREPQGAARRRRETAPGLGRTARRPARRRPRRAGARSRGRGAHGAGLRQQVLDIVARLLPPAAGARAGRKDRDREGHAGRDAMTTTNRLVRGAFDQGQVPTVACFSQATVALGVDLDRLLGGLQKFVDRHLAPVWGTPARLVRASGFVRRAWAMVFLDDADVKDALAYHDLTPDGFPLAKIFVRTTLRNGDKVSVSAAHELAEMLVDPAINLASTGPKNMLYAYETADPVESEEFPLDGVPMTDFVYPSYFEAFRKPGSTKFDHLGKLRRP